MRYSTVLFDLFGTLVLFKPYEPVLRGMRARWRSTMEWLREEVGGELPAIMFEDFVAAMARVTEEIVRNRPPEHYEVLSRERFRRTLAALGLTGVAAVEMAERLSLRHMEYLAGTTYMPPEHGTLLRALAARVNVGLVSNFDHAPTARRLLGENRIDQLLRVAIISAEFGRRKPHPSIFHAALTALGAQPDEALYIGDTLFDDVHGARAAGMDVVWINSKGAPVPEGGEAPTYTVSCLIEVEALLQ